jgi:hypothetical protein
LAFKFTVTSVTSEREFRAHGRKRTCFELSLITVTTITAGKPGVAHTGERLHFNLERAGVVLQY